MVDVASTVGRVLSAGGWAQSSRLRLLDFDVAVHSDDPELVQLVELLYEPTRAPGAAKHVLSVGEAEVDGRPGYSVALDGIQVIRTNAPSVAFAHLIFEANQQAIEQARASLVLHAAAATVGGRAVVLPGGMGAGKSTLVAGLVRAGAGYLTDETVAVADGVVRPYPRPVSLGTPPAALSEVRWRPPDAARPYLAASGLVPVDAIRPAAAVPAAPPAAIVLPCYVPGAATTVEPLDPTDALTRVAGHTFRLDRPATLSALAEWLAPLPCHRLESGSLTEAVDAVLDLASRGSTP